MEVPTVLATTARTRLLRCEPACACATALPLSIQVGVSAQCLYPMEI
jgi:hypothetical protein